MSQQNDQYNVTLEIPCPRCKGHEFRKVLIPKGPRAETVFACRKTYGTRPGEIFPDQCTGMVCYCRKCEKYYPSIDFLRSKDEFICTHCYTPHLEYSAYRRASDYIGAVVSSIKSEFGF